MLPRKAVIQGDSAKLGIFSAKKQGFHGCKNLTARGIPNDRAFMEAFCEVFDFSYTAQQVDPNQAYALQCEETPHTYERFGQGYKPEWVDGELVEITQAEADAIIAQYPHVSIPFQSASEFQQNEKSG